eukprot:scaffold41689_cov19-Tisochrysis_lutea.AAC.1
MDRQQGKHPPLAAVGADAGCVLEHGGGGGGGGGGGLQQHQLVAAMTTERGFDCVGGSSPERCPLAWRGTQQALVFEYIQAITSLNMGKGMRPACCSRRTTITAYQSRWGCRIDQWLTADHHRSPPGNRWMFALTGGCLLAHAQTDEYNALVAAQEAAIAALKDGASPNAVADAVAQEADVGALRMPAAL